MKSLKLFAFTVFCIAGSYSVSAQQTNEVRKAVQPITISTEQNQEAITKVPAATVPVVLEGNNAQSDNLKTAPHMPSATDADYAAKKDAWVKNYPQEYEKVIELNSKNIADPK